MGIGFLALGFAWLGSDLLAGAGVFMIVTGIVFLGVAGAMLLLGQRLSGARRAQDPLVQTGIPGDATVLSIRETGISFRSGLETLVGFQLEVRVPGRPPYNVALEQGVPRILLGGVVPGSVVSVRVDPVDPQKVAIDFSAAPRPGIAGSMPAGPPGTPPVGAVKSASDLLATGVRGQATVVSAQDMGMTVAQTGRPPDRPEWADDRVYLFTLEVHLD